MRRSAKTALLAALIAILAALCLVGCDNPPPNRPNNKNYPFVTQDLAEQSLKSSQHIGILSTAIGEYIDVLLNGNSGVLNYDVSDDVEISGEQFTFRLKIAYDAESADENGKNDSLFVLAELKNAGGVVLRLGVENGLLFAEKPNEDGELLRYATSSDFLNELIGSPSGGKTNFVETLKTLLPFVVFYDNSTRYGLKQQKGVEYTELTESVDFVSTCSTFARLIRAYRADSINKEFAGDERNQKLAELDERINGFTLFLFGKTYDKIFELPKLYLNLNIIMENKIATKVVMSVTQTPKFVQLAK